MHAVAAGKQATLIINAKAMRRRRRNMEAPPDPNAGNKRSRSTASRYHADFIEDRELIDGRERGAAPTVLTGVRGLARRVCFWYLQYSKISPGLKDLPPGERGKNPIHFILNLLQGQQEEEGVPLTGVGGAHAFDQTALPYDGGSDPAGGGADSVRSHFAGRIRSRDAARAHGNSRDSGPGCGDKPEPTRRPL